MSTYFQMLLICLSLARARSSLRLHLYGVRTLRRSAQSPAENQRKSNGSQRKDVLLLALINCRRQIPEPYLRLVFRAQIEALHAMHYGHVLTADTPPEHIAMQNPNWLPIIKHEMRYTLPVKRGRCGHKRCLHSCTPSHLPCTRFATITSWSKLPSRSGRVHATACLDKGPAIVLLSTCQRCLCARFHCLPLRCHCVPRA